MINSLWQISHGQECHNVWHKTHSPERILSGHGYNSQSTVSLFHSVSVVYSIYLLFFPVKVCFQLADIKFRSIRARYPFSAGNAYVTTNWPHCAYFFGGWFRRNIRCARDACYSAKRAAKLVKNLLNVRKEKENTDATFFFYFDQNNVISQPILRNVKC